MNMVSDLCRFFTMIIQMAFIVPVKMYQWLVSPFLPSACRFYPTCSVYTEQALRKHGPVRGSVLAIRRLMRCHPFHQGGIDLVP